VTAPAATQALGEAELNTMLRRVDWRLALNGRERPRLLDLGGERRSAEALALATRPAVDGAADLVLLGFPGVSALRRAGAALAPGGEVACVWSAPRPGGIQLAAARLRRAGFGRLRSFWPGPDPRAQPELWLPLESRAAIEHVFAQRPPASRQQAALRPLWRAARAGGALAPVVLLGQRPGGAAAADELDAVLPPDGLALVLHTGGDEIGSKIAAVPFPAAAKDPPPLIVKLGRGEKADAGLRREGELLRRLAAERPGLGCFPRVHAEVTRAGNVALVQEAFHGPTLSAGLDRAAFAAALEPITGWLVELAGAGPPRPPSEWSGRLVAPLLDELERDFADLFPPPLVARARRALAGLGPLPTVWEHRDLGPWNLLRTGAGLATIDWEDAEPEGLPYLDLVYFLAMAALSAENGLNERARVGSIVAAVFDPASELGAIAAPHVERYRAAVGLDAAELPRLRLLCWVLQSLTVFRHMRGRAGAESLDPEENIFPGLAAAELDRIEAT
jgi:hypothetical protein